MLEIKLEKWKVVEVFTDDDFNRRDPHESIKNKAINSILDYLSEKQTLTEFSAKEELIFFPELYGLCPRSKHDCLKLKENPDLLQKVEEYIKRTTKPDRRTPIMRHIYVYNFVEIYLDNFKLRNRVPKEIFLCNNLRVLSLNGNGLSELPPDIGRLKNLEILFLSNNRLKARSIPYTLIFCCKLHTLFLDNNMMIALPGFLLKMDSLLTLRRQSTETSFRKMLMIHRTQRIEKLTTLEPTNVHQVSSLQKIAARIIIVNKIDYFSTRDLPLTVQDMISEYYPECLICENCNTCKFEDHGYLVNTSRYGYLGNYWSSFSHLTCSERCANQVHELAYKLEKDSLAQLDDQYKKIICDSRNDSIHKTKTRSCCQIS